MQRVLKVILQYILPALLGSGLTLTLSDNIKVNCSVVGGQTK